MYLFMKHFYLFILFLYIFTCYLFHDYLITIIYSAISIYLCFCVVINTASPAAAGQVDAVSVLPDHLALLNRQNSKPHDNIKPKDV